MSVQLLSLRIIGTLFLRHNGSWVNLGILYMNIQSFGGTFSFGDDDTSELTPWKAFFKCTTPALRSSVSLELDDQTWSASKSSNFMKRSERLARIHERESGLCACYLPQTSSI